jgi:hypothetical protein
MSLGLRIFDFGNIMNHNFAEYWNITRHAYNRFVLRTSRIATCNSTDIYNTMITIRQQLYRSVWIGTSESSNAYEVTGCIADNNYENISGSALLMNNQTLFIIRGLEVATIIVAPFSNKHIRLIENAPYVPEVEKILYINHALSQENRDRFDAWGNILTPITPDPIAFFEKDLIVALQWSSNNLFGNSIVPNLSKVGKRAYSTDYALVLAQECGLHPYAIAESLAQNVQCQDIDTIVYKNGKIKFKLKCQTENDTVV